MTTTVLAVGVIGVLGAILIEVLPNLPPPGEWFSGDDVDPADLVGSWNGDVEQAGDLTGALAITVVSTPTEALTQTTESFYGSELVPQSTGTAATTTTGGGPPPGFSGMLTDTGSGCQGPWEETARDGAVVTAALDFSAVDPAVGCTSQTISLQLADDGSLDVAGSNWTAKLYPGR